MTRYTRRAVLAAGASAGALAVAGCLGDGGDDDYFENGPELTPGEPVDNLPAPTIGPAEAPVVRVFVDFSCPACLQFEDSVYPELHDRVDAGEARVQHRDFAFINDWSDRIANAARAVQDHADDESFFAFASAIFEHQGSYSYEDVEAVADEAADLGEVAAVAADAGTYDDVIESDWDYGQDRGVGGTPSVIVEDTLVPINMNDSTDRIIGDIDIAIESHQ